MTWYDGISGTAGLILLVIALCMWTIGGRMYPTVVLLCTISGVGGIMSTPVGKWIRDAWTWVTKTVGSTVGEITGVAIIIVVVLAFGFIIVLNLLGQYGSPILTSAPGDQGNPQGISGRTIGLGAAFAVTASSLPSVAGTFAAFVLGIVAHAVAWPITWGLGLL